MTRTRFLWSLPLALCFVHSSAAAGSKATSPASGVRFEQRIGVDLSLDLSFRDEQGETVELGSLLGERPAILALVYYECPMLCTRVLDSLVSSLRVIGLDVGTDFDVIVASIDPREGPELALAKESTTLERYGRPATASGWHFLTGEEEAIRRLAGEVGFQYRYEPQSGQYAHAAGIVVLTSGGRTARYFLGLEYPPRSLRLSLVEASEGRVGSVVDQVLLLCFQWDPARGRYGFAVMSALRAGGVVTVGALAALVGVLLVRERRKRRRAQERRT